jgi:hypothetical protein
MINTKLFDNQLIQSLNKPFIESFNKPFIELNLD